ncbi:AbiTii domain-containing protein [Lactococcus petauri]|uniref:AbiTii domain-containing protein n=1 Tax=Lactococcus petauri TaxID=1940789 RepID=UPI0038553799
MKKDWGYGLVKSKIIKEFVNEEISLEKALRRLIIFATDLESQDLLEWVDKELSGYKEGDELPDYRKVYAPRFVYSGLNGRFQVKRQPVPLGGFNHGEFSQKDLENGVIGDSIASIIAKSHSEEPLSRDISFLASILEENTRDPLMGIGIQAFSIKQLFEPSDFQGIVEQLKQRVLKILLKLEKEYGNLDDLDIDGSDNQEISKEITQIIYNTTNNIKSTGNSKVNLNTEDKSRNLDITTPIGDIRDATN